MVGVGAKEFVVIAIPLASTSSLCRARLSVTRQNSSSVSLLCEISTMSPGCDGGVDRIGRIYPVAGDVAGDGQEDGVPALGAKGDAGSVIPVCLADLPEVPARNWGVCGFVKEVANLVES